MTISYDGQGQNIRTLPLVDVWENCGAAEETRFTWDSLNNASLQQKNEGIFLKNANKVYSARYDRVYSNLNGKIRPKEFELVGTEKFKLANMEETVFLSGHWGTKSTFDVVN